MYHRRSGEDDVPVYVNNTAISSSLLRNKRNSSVQTTTAISSSLLSNKRNSSVQTTMDLPRKSTLSLQRHKRPQSGFKKRAKNRMKLDNSFCHAVNTICCMETCVYICVCVCTQSGHGMVCTCASSLAIYPPFPECRPKEFRGGGPVWVGQRSEPLPAV